MVFATWTFVSSLIVSGVLALEHDSNNDVIVSEEALGSEAKSANLIATGPHHAYHIRRPGGPSLVSGFSPGENCLIAAITSLPNPVCKKRAFPLF